MNIDYIASKLLCRVPDILYLKMQYRHITGRKLHLNPPVRFNEKLQWIKLYDRNPRYTMLVDKYEVKKIVSDLIGEQYVIPLIGVWCSTDEINVDTLPSKFVLKTNHDSKGVVICKDKDSFDFDSAFKMLNRHLSTSGFQYGREWPYKNVSRKIIAEQFIECDNDTLDDYKVMCFNGEPKIIQYLQGRFTNSLTQDLYDPDWNLLPFNQKNERSSGVIIDKPIFLDEMLKMSKILSNGIPHVRVDWYYANHRLYFGEMTFFDASGYLDFIPDSVNEMLGEWIILPNRKLY